MGFTLWISKTTKTCFWIILTLWSNPYMHNSCLGISPKYLIFRNAPSLLLIYVVSASFVPILRPLPFLAQLYWKRALIRRTIVKSRFIKSVAYPAGFWIVKLNVFKMAWRISLVDISCFTVFKIVSHESNLYFGCNCSLTLHFIFFQLKNFPFLAVEWVKMFATIFSSTRHFCLTLGNHW